MHVVFVLDSTHLISDHCYVCIETVTTDFLQLLLLSCCCFVLSITIVFFPCVCEWYCHRIFVVVLSVLMLLCSLLSPRASCCYIRYSVVTACICCYNITMLLCVLCCYRVSVMLCILLLPHVCCCYIWVKLICLYVILGHVCSCLVSDCTHSTLLGVPLVIWSLSSTSFIYVRDFIFAVTKYLCFSWLMLIIDFHSFVSDFVTIYHVF